MTRSRRYNNYTSAPQRTDVLSELIAGAVTGVTLGRQRVYRTITLAVIVTGVAAFAAGVWIGVYIASNQ